MQRLLPFLLILIFHSPISAAMAVTSKPSSAGFFYGHVSSDGEPVKGAMVTFYHGDPIHSLTVLADEQGRFELPIPELGSFFLLARKSFGGPAGGGELYGKYQGSGDHRVELTAQQIVQEISINVAPSQ